MLWHTSLAEDQLSVYWWAYVSSKRSLHLTQTLQLWCEDLKNLLYLCSDWEPCPGIALFTTWPTCPGQCITHSVIQVSHPRRVSSWWHYYTLYLNYQPQPHTLPRPRLISLSCYSLTVLNVKDAAEAAESFWGHRGLAHYSWCEPPNWRQTSPADFLRAKVEAVIAVVGPWWRLWQDSRNI